MDGAVREYQLKNLLTQGKIQASFLMVIGITFFFEI